MARACDDYLLDLCTRAAPPLDLPQLDLLAIARAPGHPPAPPAPNPFTAARRAAGWLAALRRRARP